MTHRRRDAVDEEMCRTRPCNFITGTLACTKRKVPILFRPRIAASRRRMTWRSTCWQDEQKPTRLNHELLASILQETPNSTRFKAGIEWQPCEIVLWPSATRVAHTCKLDSIPKSSYTFMESDAWSNLDDSRVDNCILWTRP